MSETLEKEVLEEEKKASCTIFETALFKHTFNSLANPDGELRSEIKSVLLDGMKKFVKNKINIKEDCSNLYDEALEIAFFAGVAISLGSEVTKIMEKEKMSKLMHLKELSAKIIVLGLL